MADSFTYLLTDYPRVIEPTVSVLEMSLDHGEGPRPLRLMRLDPAATHQVVVAIPSQAVHFFGESTDLARCQYILAYNTAGLLTAVFTKDGPSWVVDDVCDCDLNGAPASLPSLRLVFKEPRGRDILVHYLDQVRSGAIINPSLAMALAGLAEEIRVIDVIPQRA